MGVPPPGDPPRKLGGSAPQTPMGPGAQRALQSLGVVTLGPQDAPEGLGGRGPPVFAGRGVGKPPSDISNYSVSSIGALGAPGALDC